MGVQATKARLTGLLKQLVGEWERTRATWVDDKAREFHERYMVELIAQVEKTLAAIDKLDALIQRVNDDCE